jgi:hypothetical protein
VAGRTHRERRSARVVLRDDAIIVLVNLLIAVVVAAVAADLARPAVHQRLGVVAVGTATVVRRVAISVGIARVVATRLRRFLANVDGTRAVVAARHGLAEHATVADVATLDAVAVPRIIAHAVVGRETATSNLLVASVLGATHAIVALAVVLTRPTERRIDARTPVHVEFEPGAARRARLADISPGSRPERARHPVLATREW